MRRLINAVKENKESRFWVAFIWIQFDKVTTKNREKVAFVSDFGTFLREYTKKFFLEF